MLCKEQNPEKMSTYSMPITFLSVYAEATKAEIIISLCFFLSFLFSAFVLPRIIIISKRKALYDDPDARKSHIGAIPRLGGLVFIPSILISLSFSTAIRFLLDFPANDKLTGYTLLELLLLAAGSLFLYFVGVKDDLIGVRYRKKFIAQFLVASLFPMSGLYINNLYGMFGIYEVPAMIGIPFTIVMIVFITNAVNLIDGIDGLAAGGALVCFITFGTLYLLREEWIYSMLAFAVVGCLLPFMYYNIFGSVERGTKLFMGDSGSLSLGYLLSFFAVKYTMFVPNEGMDIRCAIIPLSLLFVPVFDALRVMVVRVYHKHPVFLADRNHIHHKCLAAGFTHLQSTVMLVSYTVVTLFVNLGLGELVDLNIILIINILLAVLINHLLDVRIKHKEDAKAISFSNSTGL